MTTPSINTLEFQDSGETIDPISEIQAIPHENWSISILDSEDSGRNARVRRLLVSANTQDDGCGSVCGREYQFEIHTDLLLGTHIGDPILTIFYVYEDGFKGDREELKQYSASDSRKLFEVMQETAKRNPVNPLEFVSFRRDDFTE